MSVLDRYIGFAVARGYLLVALILFGLFSFLEFMEQLDDVGDGEYRIADAFVFVLCLQPRRLLDLVPFVALLGTVMALGGLAASSEIIAMQAAGVSPRRIGWAVLKAGLVLMVAVAILDQFIASPLQQYAHNRRTMAVLSTGDLRNQQGFWSRDGNRFINVRDMIHGLIPSDIDIYQFDEHGRLRVFTEAKRAETFDFSLKQWLLIDVRQRLISDEGIILRNLGSMRWDSFLTPSQIQVLAVPQESLSISDLYHYVNYLKGGGLEAYRYEMVLWQKLTLPLATGAMVLLAVPFVFGPMRSVGSGKMIFMGAMTGIVFYMIKQIVENTGLLLGVTPVLTVSVPVVLTVTAALLLMRRVD
jgi:lipopolysaccharide export system permease protein